jgi:hypothetical protein
MTVPSEKLLIVKYGTRQMAPSNGPLRHHHNQLRALAKVEHQNSILERGAGARVPVYCRMH